MKSTRNNKVECERTALGFVPSEDLATLAALILALDNAFSENLVIYTAMREANAILVKVANKLNPSDPFA